MAPHAVDDVDDRSTNGFEAGQNHVDNSRCVLIVGAGSTGLALAQGLKQAGIPFNIFDKEEAPNRARTWTMGLHWGMDPLEKLVPKDILAGIRQAQVDPHRPTGIEDRLPMVNGATGDLLFEIKSNKFYRLRRDKFRKLLLTGIDVQWGKALKDISYGDSDDIVTAHFADGTSASGCVLVGTDGPHSQTRTLLLGAEKAKVTPTDFASTMCFTKHNRERALYLRALPHNPLYQVAPHPDGHCAWLSLHDGDDAEHPENWTFFHYISFREPRDFVNNNTNAKHIAHQKSLAKNYIDPFRSVFEWMPDDMEVWYSKLRNWDPSLPEQDWNNRRGRVTLAGDAAHPMTFQRGQGLNHALQDAFTVCEAIKKFAGENGSVAKRVVAIGAYEEEMKARGGEEVRLSEENTKAVHDWSKVKVSPSAKKGMNVDV